MKQEKFDVAVIGSGIGGLCSAALLAHRGYKTLVVEKLPRIGGRCSTLDYKGFKIITGVIAVPTQGALREIFDEVGAPFELAPVTSAGYIVDGKDFRLPERGGFRALLSALSDDETEVNHLVNAIRRADTWKDPSNELSLDDWLSQYTSNRQIRALFKTLGDLYLVANMKEGSAREFFRQRRGQISAYGRPGIPPRGSIILMEELAKTIQAKGGEVRTRCRAKKILVEEGKVKSVIVEGLQGETDIVAQTIIGNGGPKNTVALAGRENFDNGYLKEVDDVKPGFQMWITIASDKPLHDIPYLTTIGTQRMLGFITPSLICPELAPPGKHIHFSLSGPLSQVEPIDPKKEVELHIEEIRQNIPRFNDHGEILHVGCYSGEWPVVRQMPMVGFSPLSQKTPAENLYNVGDGVGISGWLAGCFSCAISARMVVEDIEKRIQPERKR